MHIMTEAILINHKILSRNYGIDYSCTSWSILHKQKHSSKINPFVIKTLHNYILNHHYVKECSCSKDCIEIEVGWGDENFGVTKLYLQVNIKDLYDGISKPPSLGVLTGARDNEWNIIINDSKLHELLPSKLQLISKKGRYFCGYGEFILAGSLQVSLDACRLRHIIHLEKSSESRCRSRSSGLFQESFRNHRF